MRLRTTAAALVGALALVLPTGGLSYANGHDDDREHLGTLHYRYTNEDGARRDGKIRPADNDTCYRLGRRASEVDNQTKSLAVVYSNRSCGGVPEAEVEPGDQLWDTAVRSVYFKPVDDDRHEGRHDGRHEEGRHDGRHDDDRRDDDRRDDDRRDDDRRDQWRDDEDRSHGDRVTMAPPEAPVERTSDILDHVFRSIG